MSFDCQSACSSSCAAEQMSAALCSQQDQSSNIFFAMGKLCHDRQPWSPTPTPLARFEIIIAIMIAIIAPAAKARAARATPVGAQPPDIAPSSDGSRRTTAFPPCRGCRHRSPVKRVMRMKRVERVERVERVQGVETVATVRTWPSAVWIAGSVYRSLIPWMSLHVHQLFKAHHERQCLSCFVQRNY